MEIEGILQENKLQDISIRLVYNTPKAIEFIDSSLFYLSKRVITDEQTEAPRERSARRVRRTLTIRWDRTLGFINACLKPQFGARLSKGGSLRCTRELYIPSRRGVGKSQLQQEQHSRNDEQR